MIQVEKKIIGFSSGFFVPVFWRRITVEMVIYQADKTNKKHSAPRILESSNPINQQSFRGLRYFNIKTRFWFNRYICLYYISIQKINKIKMNPHDGFFSKGKCAQGCGLI